MEKHSVVCKYDDISVLQLDCSRHWIQNVWYLLPWDRIRMKKCSITNAFGNYKPKMSLRPVKPELGFQIFPCVWVSSSGMRTIKTQDWPQFGASQLYFESYCLDRANSYPRIISQNRTRLYKQTVVILDQVSGPGVRLDQDSLQKF